MNAAEASHSDFNDEHSSLVNGVTEADVDQSFQFHLGDSVNATLGTYETYGPPPPQTFVSILHSTFGTGYAAGYRRCHIDLTTGGTE